jgi:hypothetical protein
MNLLALSLCQEIISVVDRANASTHALVELHLSNLKVLGNVNRFVMSRIGSTGSTWLAKLLNAHPDVYCTHEGFLARVYPADHPSHEDILRFIEYFAWDTQHEAYRVLVM